MKMPGKESIECFRDNLRYEYNSEGYFNDHISKPIKANELMLKIQIYLSN